MKIKVAELKKALDIAVVGIATTDTIEQANRFIFKNGKIITFNDEILTFVDSPLGDFEGAVIAKEFKLLLNKFSDSTLLDISYTKESLLIDVKEKGRKISAGISLYEDIKLPLEEIITPENLKSWKELPEDFNTALGVAATNTSKTEQILMCVHVSDFFVEACNNINIVRYSLDNDEPLDDMVIYGKTAKTISQFNLTHYVNTKNWMYFKVKDGLVIGCRNFYQQNYPNLDNFFEFKSQSIPFPLDLKEAVLKAKTFLETSYNEDITLLSKDGWLIVEANGDHGWFKEKIKDKLIPENISLSINASQFLYLLSFTNNIHIGKKLAKIEGEKTIQITILKES